MATRMPSAGAVMAWLALVGTVAGAVVGASYSGACCAEVHDPCRCIFRGVMIGASIFGTLPFWGPPAVLMLAGSAANTLICCRE